MTAPPETVPFSKRSLRRVRRALGQPFGAMPSLESQGPTRTDAQVLAETLAAQVAPPGQLACLHDVNLFRACAAHIADAVLNPVGIRLVKGVPVIEIARIAVLVRTPTGGWAAFFRALDRCGRPTLDPIAEDQVVLPGLPWRDHWLHAMLTLLVAVLAARKPPTPRILEPARHPEATAEWLQWAARVFYRRLARTGVLRAMRSRVWLALDLDAWALHVARRALQTNAPRGRFLLGNYNRALRHRTALERLAEDAPNLLPLYLALCEDPWIFLPECHAEPLQALRYCLKLENLGRVIWRLVLSSPANLFRPLATHYGDTPGEAAIWYLRLLEWLGLRQPPTRPLLRALFSQDGMLPRRDWGQQQLADALRSLSYMRQVVATAPLSEPQSEQDRQDVALVLDFIRQTAPASDLDRNQVRGGWPWLLSQARRWHEARRFKLAAEDATWTVPRLPLQFEGREWAAISDSGSLWEEAKAMRHCADLYANECRRQRVLIVSIREAGRRVATAAYAREGGCAVLSQIRGFANADAAPQLQDSARRFALLIPSPALHPPQPQGNEETEGGDPQPPVAQ